MRWLKSRLRVYGPERDLGTSAITYSVVRAAYRLQLQITYASAIHAPHGLTKVAP
jgi:hypothetical protein